MQKNKKMLNNLFKKKLFSIVASFFPLLTSFFHFTIPSNEVFSDVVSIGVLANQDNASTDEEFRKINLDCFFDVEKSQVTINDISKTGTPTEWSQVLNLTFKSSFDYKGVSYKNIIIGNAVFSSSSYWSKQINQNFSGTINFTNSVVEIQDRCFEGLDVDFDFTNATNLSKIGKEAFKNCNNLEKLNLSSVSSTSLVIDDNSFSETGVKSIVFPKSNNTVKSVTIGKEAFSQCKELQEQIVFTNSITTIDEEAFKGDLIKKIDFEWNQSDLDLISVFSTSFPTLDIVSSLCSISVPYGMKYAYEKYFKLKNIVICPTPHTIDEYITGPDFVLNATDLIDFSINDSINPNDLTFPVEVSILDRTANPKQLSIDSVIRKIEATNITFHDKISINGEEFEVAQIGDNAFEDFINITGTIHFPSTLQRIGKQAFAAINPEKPMRISKLDFSKCNLLEEISDSAFKNCIFLSDTIYIPKTLVKFGENAFQNTGAFSYIDFAYDDVNSFKNIQISNVDAIPNLIADGKIEIVISSYENYLDFFKEKCFNKYSSDDIDIYETSQFFLNDVATFINAPTSIGITCILDYYHKTASIKKISDDLSIAKNVNFLNSFVYQKTEFTIISILDEAFLNCSNITGDLVISKSIRLIGVSAFKSSGISSISFEENSSLTQISKNSFVDCKNLINIDFSNCPNISIIGDEAFVGCSQLEGEMVFPKSIYSIGKNIFDDNTFFSKIDFNWDSSNLQNLEFIDQSSFPNIVFEGNIYIPPMLTEIYRNFFKDNFILKYDSSNIISNDLNLSSTIIFTNKKINDVIVKCSISNYSEILINDVDDDFMSTDLQIKPFVQSDDRTYTVSEINDYAFTGCSKIFGMITFPSSIKKIGNSSFQSRDLKPMNISGIDFSNATSLISLGSSCFKNVKNLSGNIFFPKSLIRFGSDCFLDSGYVNSITFNWTPDQLSGNDIVVSNENSLPNVNLNGKLIVPFGTIQDYRSFFAKNNIHKYDNVEIIDQYTKQSNKTIFTIMICSLSLLGTSIICFVIFYSIWRIKRKN